MHVVFAGVILGIILMFFIMAWVLGAIFFVVPLAMIAVVCIQVFLRIRDEVLDNRDPNR